MPKLNRNQLKGIVKECLMEILSEGLMADTPPRPAQTRPAARKREAVQSKNDGFATAVTQSVAAMTDNPVMAEIFADTARTTLQEQLGAEQGGPMVTGGDSATRQMAGSDPDEIFGEAANRWASLAFTEKTPVTE